MSTLYVIGDSFSSGSELTDHMLPSCPYNTKPVRDTPLFLKWIRSNDFLNDLKTLNLTKDQLAELAKDRAYPAKLGKLLDYEVINRGTGNTGTVYWRYKVLEDMIAFKKTGKTIDYAIVQFTDAFRDCFPIIDMNNLFFQHVTPMDDFASMYFKYKSSVQSDMSYYYHMLTDLHFIKSTLHSMGAKKVFFVSSLNLSWMLEIKKFTHTNNLKELLDLNINTLPVMENDKVNFLLGGHFCEETHNLFAKRLAKEFFGKEV
jgi:hypothetical protein